MFCPKCSQQQSSDEVRFCSRCGFQLGVVKELIAQAEAPAPVGVEPVAAARPRGLRRRDVTVGALLMFVVGLIVVLIPDTTPPPIRDGQLVLLVGLFIALTLLINFISPLLRAANRLFGEEDDAYKQRQVSPPPQAAPDLSTRVSANAQRDALPPPRAVPAAAFNPQRANTAEMVGPPSVTERTTNLLDNK